MAFCGPKHKHFVSGHPPGKLGGHFINIMSMLLQASKLLLLINKECVSGCLQLVVEVNRIKQVNLREVDYHKERFLHECSDRYKITPSINVARVWSLIFWLQ